MTTAVATDRLGKSYGARWALRHCDLAVPEGRVIALVGPNGAGKTTLLRLAAGLTTPSQGSIALFGEPSSPQSAQALTRSAFVAQDHPLYRRFRVADLLHLGRSLNHRWDQTMAEQRLADHDISLRRRAGHLSGGQQAQVALVLALAKRPRLLILDEPVASLDPLARRDFMQALMAIVADGGLTVLLSSHNVAELERVCDYLIVIANGRVQLAGDIEDLLEDHRLLVGPGVDLSLGGSLIHADRSDRHTQVIARTGSAVPMPGWQSHPVGLEELVLAYLRRAHRSPHREDMVEEGPSA